MVIFIHDNLKAYVSIKSGTRPLDLWHFNSDTIFAGALCGDCQQEQIRAPVFSYGSRNEGCGARFPAMLGTCFMLTAPQIFIGPHIALLC